MVRGNTMGKFAKKYVLVEKDVYDRRFKDSTENHPVKLPNPFQNQNVSRAHSLRKDMFTVLKDTSLSPSEANAMVEDMLSEYRKNFNNVGGRSRKKKSQSTTRNSEYEILPTPKRNTKDESVTNEDANSANDSHKERAVVMDDDDEDWSIRETPTRLGRAELQTGKRLDFNKTANENQENGYSDLPYAGSAEESVADNETVESLTPFTTPSEGKLDVLAPQDIPQIMKRKLSPDQISKLYPLVNEMYKTRIIDDTTGNFLPITGQGQRFTGDQVRTAINDIMLNSPSHRSTDPRKANWLIDYLNKRGVVETAMSRPKKRTSNRRRR